MLSVRAHKKNNWQTVMIGGLFWHLLVLSNTKSLSYNDHWSNYLLLVQELSWVELEWGQDGHKGFCMNTHHSHNTIVIYSPWIFVFFQFAFQTVQPTRGSFYYYYYYFSRKSPRCAFPDVFFFLRLLIMVVYHSKGPVPNVNSVSAEEERELFRSRLWLVKSILLAADMCRRDLQTGCMAHILTAWWGQSRWLRDTEKEIVAPSFGLWPHASRDNLLQITSLSMYRLRPFSVRVCCNKSGRAPRPRQLRESLEEL